MDEPAPLRLPAILQNPVDRARRQAEAHAAQRREHVAAVKRREARPAAPITSGNRGRRVLRRMDNASFLDNPHASAPAKSDLYPSVPLHPRPARASFPPAVLPLSAAAPSTSSLPSALRDTSFADPAASSAAGQFSTSLRGVRQLLRGRGQGRRAETAVRLVEGEVRRWLAGHWAVGWRAVDAAEVEYVPADGAPGGVVLPPLPGRDGDATGAPCPRVPAILALASTPDALALALADPFDRLVAHLVARYYRLVSRSHVAATTAGDRVRLTVLEVPHVRVVPGADAVGVPAAAAEILLDDDATPRAGRGAPNGRPANATPTRTAAPPMPDLAALSLTRTLSSSSARTVASDATDATDASADTLASDFTVVSAATADSADSALSSLSSAPSDASALSGYSDLSALSAAYADVPARAAPPAYRPDDPDAPPAWSIEAHVEWSADGGGGAPAVEWVAAGVDDWADRPSFFDYLFG